LSYGIQTFLWWDSHFREWDLELVRQMRFGYVKQIFAWKDIQSLGPDYYDWSIADEIMAEVDYRGLKLIARIGKAPDWALRPLAAVDDVPINLAAWETYCYELAARYRGRIAGYQVWNEPNLRREWNDNPPNAAGYTKLLAACQRGLKRGDPAAIVISAGLAPTATELPNAIPDDLFLRQLYSHGFAQYYDVLGVNAPGYRSPPTTSPDDPALDGQRWQSFRHVEDIRRIMVEAGEGAKQVAILEMGWTTDQRETIADQNGNQIPNPYRWHAVTQAQQSEYLVSAYQYAALHWRPWMGLMTMIYLADPGWTEVNEEYWWAISRRHPDYRLLQAFVDLANMERYIDAQLIPTQDSARSPYTPLPPRPRP
jgi:hypothetical protein